ncbi:hypothetical protein V8D89_004021, partial [Ganoderma adspersum]
SLVDVDFEFFDPNPDIDYLATKRLLIQLELFNADAQDLPIHDLTDLILSQPLVGTTVKCDGRESDPYAFLTVLNFNVHKDRLSIKALVAYILEKASPDPVLHAKLQALLGQSGLTSSDHIGFIFSERLINMPVQIVPHMYRMLADEIQWALDDVLHRTSPTTHFVIISRIYRLTAEEAADLQAAAPPTKRQKRSNPPPVAGVYSFHPATHPPVYRMTIKCDHFATHTMDYTFTHTQLREADSFGLDMGGRRALIPATRLRDLAAALAEEYPQPS